MDSQRRNLSLVNDKEIFKLEILLFWHLPGFHLSASVVSPQQTAQGKLSTFNVAVTFDRRRITSCNCTCASRAFWCAHVVAVCLYRIHQVWTLFPFIFLATQFLTNIIFKFQSHLVTLRAPVSESLSRLQRDQLQKFAQYLISELPQQILPTAQRLLDELLSAQPSAINTVIILTFTPTNRKCIYRFQF